MASALPSRRPRLLDNFWQKWKTQFHRKPGQGWSTRSAATAETTTLERPKAHWAQESRNTSQCVSMPDSRDQHAVAEHVWQDGHRIDWKGVEILDVASNHEERLMKEAVYIHLSAPGVRMNRDEGKEISCVCHGPLKKLAHRDSHPRRHRTSAMQTTPTSTVSAPPTEASWTDYLSRTGTLSS